jgi:predicted nucleic acid-binding protein
VRVFFDTSVLVAVALVRHIHHAPSFAAYLAADRNHAFCAAHTLAEVYSTLTRIPVNQRLSGEQALVFLDQVAHRITAVSLGVEEYRSIIAKAAADGLLGGIIYDALLASCALKVKADEILTWDVNDFRRLGPEVARRVRTP